ncbi:MAG TPA: DUF4139 domain-containing protein, partial [Terriglobales bacterium]|nr:DUF4139 domain-containing protein [Terriglobales bacterium]
MPMLEKVTAAVALALCPLAHAAVQEKPSTLADQQSVAVTIYNENLALVKDQRRIGFDAGRNRLALREVSARMRPETALLRSLSHPGSLSLLEQNFDFDLLTPAKLLEKYVGRQVRVFRINPKSGEESFETATVLAANAGVVLRIGDRIETGLPGRIVYDGVPANLRDRPTLVSELDAARSGAQTVELSYLTGGLSWKADYVAELNAADTALDLNGWVTLTNQSGTAYPNARLQLVAGDVNRVPDELRVAKAMLAQRAAAAEAPRNDMAQESLFEYHLYTLQRPTTISDNQTKQVALLAAQGVPVTKELVLQGSDYYYRSSVGGIGQKLKVGVFVQLENRESSRLGMPMPKGVVRVYKKDSAGNAQFVGEDRIDHTPKNETVRLKLGEAFDVTADKKQTDFKRREPTNRASYVFESAYEIVLRNAKKEA